MDTDGPRGSRQTDVVVALNQLSPAADSQAAATGREARARPRRLHNGLKMAT
jgi:hypothetical protein